MLSGPSASGGAALCWNVSSRRYQYDANAGSDTITSWRTDSRGRLTVVEPVAATTAAGPIDLAVTADDDFLYAIDAVAGAVQGWAIERDGGLTPVELEDGLPAFDPVLGGMEGIVAI